MNEGFRILIVDDEPNIRSGLAMGLEREADEIETAGCVKEALDKFDAQAFQIVIADVRLPGGRDGLELLSLIHQRQPNTTIIMITAHGTVEMAVDAMRRGAFDFITKPVDLNLIRQQIAKAVEHHRLQTENRLLKDRLAEAGELQGIIGNCRSLNDLLQQIRQVATTDATVLVHGESGTGKELIARAIHDLSGRSTFPFVPVNLGALPENLLETELFGHEKGAFTGASRQKPGCFERSMHGTLFLDEISEISMKSQVDLLRVLETGQFTRVGGEETLISDTRIVSATNRDIPQLVEDGTFREDLFYRLNIVPIEVPSLRQRREDIPLLADHFLVHFCARHHRPLKQIDAEAVQALVSANWPGNIRQLRNVIERLVVTVTGERIGLEHLPAEASTLTRTGADIEARSLAEVAEKAEREAILTCLAANDFHREQTAKVLGVSVRTLHYKMSRYGLH
ncbi:sigma-54-dependent transcriptional regulator [Blastopirellula marina]|uniref:Sigma-54-dependent Fis family transcriptional regulator n=1 Tax=Blastopirellula marina TaxID=124 RepID=A0A2S8F9U3_9BACT|nr:sigma-54 dependent transcriptional regulator [Blastopirellula marina]PQO28902.1 sigma-54-dependent Fis family transcriptional regulator [Blastopirellula marina]PTL42175.1 sigma-54-dependent Fis family transcriptional regulator [Blastopirellula marina]